MLDAPVLLWVWLFLLLTSSFGETSRSRARLRCAIPYRNGTPGGFHAFQDRTFAHPGFPGREKNRKKCVGVNVSGESSPH